MLFPNAITLTDPPPWLAPYIPAQARQGRVAHSFRITGGERKVYRKKAYLPPSAWNEKHRTITDGPLAGRLMDLDITPHLRGFMDASFFPSVRRIRNCKSVQVAGSVGVHGCLYYAMDRKPGPAMLAAPDKVLATKTMRDRFLKTIKASPPLRKLLTGVEDDVSTLRLNLSTMLLYAAWSGSISSLGDFAAMYLIKEEADKWEHLPSKTEADSHDLVDKRVTTFPYDSKMWDNSTPSVVTGHIWQALTTETQIVSDFWVVCPDCGRHQVMTFSQIKWPGGSKANRVEVLARKLAYYVCRFCGTQWDDYRRDLAARAGKWRSLPTGEWRDRIAAMVDKKELDAMDGARDMFATLESERPEDIGFYMPCWWSYFVSLSKPANTFLKYRQSGDLDVFKDFRNNFEGLPWKHKVISKAGSEILAARCALPPQTVPQEAVALTSYVDMQKRGFWFAVRAWARDYTSWLIHYGQLFTWDEVETHFFDTYYPQEGTDIKFRIWRGAIDTGGGEGTEGITKTEEAYYWLLRNRIGRGCIVEGTKGASRPLAGKLQVGKPLLKTPSGRGLPGGLRIIQLDTNKLKDSFHYRLAQAAKGEMRAAYLHAGTDDEYKDYVAQILAEEKEIVKGVETWVQKSRDNHLLDCECGNIALADPEWPGGGVHILRPVVEKSIEAAETDDPEKAGLHNFNRPDWLNR